MKYGALLIFLTYMIQPSLAQDRFTARVLESICSPDQQEPAKAREQAEVVCGTYLLGLTDALFVMQSLARESQRTCMPANTAVAVAEARRIFHDWLVRNPQHAENTAGLVAAMAIVNAYKCSR
jgi:hypothetical protein